MKNKLKEAILIILNQYRIDNPDEPEMAFTELCSELFADPNSKIGEIRTALYNLTNHKSISGTFVGPHAGLFQVTGNGVRYAEQIPPGSISLPLDIGSEASEGPHLDEDGDTGEESGKFPPGAPPPVTAEDIIRYDPECAIRIERDALLSHIIRLIQIVRRRSFIVLHGEPMMGKTKILTRLSEELGDEFIPLKVNTQGLRMFGSFESLDRFTFDLADQFTNRFREWIRHHQIPSTLDNPKLGDFDKNGVRAFFDHWRKIQQIAGERELVVLFDDVEYLLDLPEEPDPDIIAFLQLFVRNPYNGIFVLVGSESIRYTSNRTFADLIGRATAIRIGHYNQETIDSVFVAIRKFYAYDDHFSHYFTALSNGHPRILWQMLDVILDQLGQSPGKTTIETTDIRPIQERLIRSADTYLRMMGLHLSIEELYVAWLISRKGFALIDQLDCSVEELVQLAEQHQPGSKLSETALIRGVVNLETREWVAWKDRDTLSFRFKLGIFPMWLRYKYLTPEEVYGHESHNLS